MRTLLAGSARRAPGHSPARDDRGGARGVEVLAGRGGALRRRAGAARRAPLRPCRPGARRDPRLRGGGERGDDPNRRGRRRRRRRPPDGDAPLHRRGDAAGDRRGRPAGRSRRGGRRSGGLGDRGRVRRRRTGARGRQAPDRLPRHRAHVRPDPGAARVRRRRRTDQGAVAELRPGRDDRAGHRRDARRDGSCRHRRRLPHGTPEAGRGRGSPVARRAGRGYGLPPGSGTTTTRSSRRSAPPTPDFPGARLRPWSGPSSTWS